MNRLLIFLLNLIPIACLSQTIEYQMFIYTDNNLSEEIQAVQVASRQKGIEDMFNAGKDAIKGIASGYVTSVVDLGVNAIASLVTRNARLKAEWEDMVQKENMYTTEISTVSEVNDFYSMPSSQGAMDPIGMKFNGIGCLRKEGQDTVFYVSCHIDKNKLERIINHSKFELILDTLIISPTHSNLPNTTLDIPFSFKERKNFCFTLNMKLTSSWINHLTQLFRDQELGNFTLSVPVDSVSLDERGFFRYVREEDSPSKYKIIGESFIVPRSFMPYRNSQNLYQNSWGTGEYKLAIELRETCDITDSYRENWKADRKRRKKMMPSEGILTRSWQTITNQRWDEISQQWIITTLKAPAGVFVKDLIDKLGLETDPSTTKDVKSNIKP